MNNTHTLNKLEQNIEKQLRRDQDIFKFLCAGPALREHIQRELFRKDDGSLCHIRTVDVRLGRLCEMEYLKVKIYQSTRSRYGYRVYALDERGVSEATNNFSLERDYVRRLLPKNTNFLSHELMLSDMFRAIYREAEEGKYGLGYLMDEYRLKKQQQEQNKGFKPRGHYFADGAVLILPRYKNPMTFYIELDAGTKSGSYWRQKIASLSESTLVFALSQTRLDLLKRYAVANSRNKSVGFALAPVFAKKGFSETEFDWVPEGNKLKIDLL